MEIDRRYCFNCDQLLEDAPDEDEPRLRFCAACTVDLEEGRRFLEGIDGGDPPNFVGAVPLNAPLTGWPTEIALLALDAWDGFVELTYIERPGADPPPPHPRMAPTSTPRWDQQPRKWTVTSNVGTVHHSSGGGAGTPGTDVILSGDVPLHPALPATASSLVVEARAPGAGAKVSVVLPGWRPASLQHAEIARGQGSRIDCPSCGPPPPPLSDEPPAIELAWTMPPPPPARPRPPQEKRPLCDSCRRAMETVFGAKDPPSAHPEQVLALNADLGSLFGSRLNMSTLARWPTWFDLVVHGGGHPGAWSDTLVQARRAAVWSAEDDRGHRYVGARARGHGRFGLTTIDLSFIPALDPAATTLTVHFPVSLDGSATHATVSLSRCATALWGPS